MSGGNFVTLGPIPDSQNDGVQHLNVSALNVVGNTAGTIIPAVSGKRIFVHGYALSVGTSQFLTFLDCSTAGATVAVQQALNFPSSIPVVLPYQQYPWATCAPGDSFAVSLTGGQTVNLVGTILYTQG